MTAVGASPAAPVARLSGVSLRYGRNIALDAVDLELPAGTVVGLIGPDGVGKSSLLAVLVGARRIREGEVNVFGGDMRRRHHRDSVGPRIAYMPQGLGRNLYPTLSVEENLQFFGRLFDQDAGTRRERIDALTQATGLHPFLDRPAGNLSGGMKQKLGLCCALIHDPDLLVLDEPTTGVDPLARSQFWQLLARIRAGRPGMSVVVATAYMEEADGFDWIVAMNAGRVLATGTPAEIRRRTGSDSLEMAFIRLLPEEIQREHRPVTIPPLSAFGHEETAIEASGLTKRFGHFTAVDRVSFRIRRGEIFGFLGSNGCGKTTTMKMLTGLLPASEGRAWLFGAEVNPHDLATRRRVGYMSQSFSLYSELTLEQNLVLHAQLFQVPAALIPARVEATLGRFGLTERRRELPESLPLGLRQRLSLAVAMVHEPELLILDEPTSGVDPVARDVFWQLLIDLARGSGVTVFVSTHYMNEAERCDRVSFMHAGRVLVSDAPAEIVRRRGARTLEEAFIAYLREAAPPGETATPAAPAPGRAHAPQTRFSPRRMLGYVIRETLELRRDPVRATLAMMGSILLMLIIAYGLSLDVQNLRFAVLDRDDTSLSRDYTLNLAGSRYFLEQRPLADEADLDRRMRTGELALAVEIPPGFARQLKRGAPVQVGAWIDGAMPARADTVRGYVASLHQQWLVEHLRQAGIDAGSGYATVETRFRYNPEVTSLPAMVPAVIPLLLLMLPAMLTALAVVREKELGSIVNFYVTPVTRIEFLFGKQLPYLALGMLNYLLMVLMAVTLFGVPLKGSFAALTLAALVFTSTSTGLGLFASVFTRSQIGAMFFTLAGTLLPAISYAGLLDPVSSLEGAGRVIGELFPATHLLTISRGVFAKGLGFADLSGSFWPLLLALPAILGLTLALLRKQET